MKKVEIQIGGHYIARVSGVFTVLRVDAENKYGGWDCTNIRTNRSVLVRGAMKFRRAATAEQIEAAKTKE